MAASTHSVKRCQEKLYYVKDQYLEILIQQLCGSSGFGNGRHLTFHPYNMRLKLGWFKDYSWMHIYDYVISASTVQY